MYMIINFSLAMKRLIRHRYAWCNLLISNVWCCCYDRAIVINSLLLSRSARELGLNAYPLLFIYKFVEYYLQHTSILCRWLFTWISKKEDIKMILVWLGRVKILLMGDLRRLRYLNIFLIWHLWEVNTKKCISYHIPIIWAFQNIF